MKRRFSLSLALAAALLASPALAGAIDDIDTVATEDLETLRGGSDTPDAVQANSSTTSQSNTAGGTSISDHSSKVNGTIGTATISGNHGIASQMINSGDNNIMNAATNINIYLK